MAIRPHHVTVLDYELLVYHLESGSSAWLNGRCIGRLTKVKDQYKTESGELFPLDQALEHLVRVHSAETSGVEILVPGVKRA